MSQRQVSILLLSGLLTLVIWYKITNISQKSVNYIPKLEAKYSSEALQIHKRINFVAPRKTALCRYSGGSCRIFPFFLFLLLLLLLFRSLLLDISEEAYPRSPKNNRHTASKRKECDVTHLCLFAAQRERSTFFNCVAICQDYIASILYE